MDANGDAPGNFAKCVPSGSLLHASPDARGQIRVLVVEHQSLIQSALAALIDSAEGIEVVATADNVAGALEATERLKPDIVLVSIRGEWGVFSAVGEITHRHPASKVVLLDDRPLDINAREALRVRATGYLTKEQPFHQVENALRRGARRSRLYARRCGPTGSFGRRSAPCAGHQHEPVSPLDSPRDGRAGAPGAGLFR